jgi:excisionase family DNA binding protein
MGRTETNSVDCNPPRDFAKPLWVSPRRASQLTGIGLTRLYELLNEGAITSRKIGRGRLVSYASLESLGESRGGQET